MQDEPCADDPEAAMRLLNRHLLINLENAHKSVSALATPVYGIFGAIFNSVKLNGWDQHDIQQNHDTSPFWRLRAVIRPAAAANAVNATPDGRSYNGLSSSSNQFTACVV